MPLAHLCGLRAAVGAIAFSLGEIYKLWGREQAWAGEADPPALRDGLFWRVPGAKHHPLCTREEARPGSLGRFPGSRAASGAEVGWGQPRSERRHWADPRGGRLAGRVRAGEREELGAGWPRGRTRFLEAGGPGACTRSGGPWLAAADRVLATSGTRSQVEGGRGRRPRRPPRRGRHRALGRGRHCRCSPRWRRLGRARRWAEGPRRS